MQFLAGQGVNRKVVLSTQLAACTRAMQQQGCCLGMCTTPCRALPPSTQPTGAADCSLSQAVVVLESSYSRGLESIREQCGHSAGRNCAGGQRQCQTPVCRLATWQHPACPHLPSLQVQTRTVIFLPFSSSLTPCVSSTTTGKLLEKPMAASCEQNAQAVVSPAAAPAGMAAGTSAAGATACCCSRLALSLAAEQGSNSRQPSARAARARSVGRAILALCPLVLERTVVAEVVE